MEIERLLAFSFEMSLIKGLSNDLKAKLAMKNNYGTILKIKF